MRIVDKSPGTVGVTRAFVVGVGAYPHLPANLAAARDLSTAAASAVAFAEWLATKYQNGNAPLASVDLVLSPGSFQGNWCQGQVEPATLAEVKRVCQEKWFKDVTASAHNVAIFYFAGHGLWYDEPYLLTEDFNPANAADPWGGSFSMEATHNGMARCNAGYQAFFIEACQSIPWDLYQAPGIGTPGLLGRSIASSAREAPIVYASKPHEPAFGSAGQVANFTSALLEFLGGAGAEQRNDGSWHIATSHLNRVREIMEFRAEMENIPDQEPLAELSGGRTFTSFASAPEVQAHVTTLPSALMAEHGLDVTDIHQNSAQQFGPNADASPWRITLPKGLYKFAAGPVPKSPLILPILKPRPVVVLS
jgi:hypothetical protein